MISHRCRYKARGSVLIRIFTSSSVRWAAARVTLAISSLFCFRSSPPLFYHSTRIRMTLEEEQQFLAPFFARAEEGLIATTAEIWPAFEARVGHHVDDSSIYRLLDRHGWRKLMPRPRHPKADPQAKEQFKKTLQRRIKRQSQRGKR